MKKKIKRCNIKQYLIAIHYTHDAFLYAKETDKLYMMGIFQVNPPQKFPDKNAEKYINMKRQISLQSIMCIAKLSPKAHRPQNRNHSEKNVSAETVPP